MKPVELNYGVSVDELWERIYEVNKAHIDNASIGGIYTYEKQIKGLLAGLAIPISIERDTLQKYLISHCKFY